MAQERTGDSKDHKRIAVIGAGIAGLGAAWALSRRHTVSVYEQEARLGGHANTATLDLAEGAVDVDTGFIVYNDRNYPNLVRLFENLGVETHASDMSFGVSLAGGDLEYAGGDLRGLFAQPSNTLKPRFWRMLGDIRRFYRNARAYHDTAAPDESIGDLLAREAYSEPFIDDHLMPMAAAIWSASRSDIHAYPARAFISFFENHGLVTLRDRPQWRTVTGGSRHYVERLRTQTGADWLTGHAVVAVQRDADGVTVTDASGQQARFDAVVFATHADVTLKLLVDPSEQEREVLGAFAYSRNDARLHEDRGLMPRRASAWSSWNYIEPHGAAPDAPLCVSYWMNRLQPLATTRDLIVTLNPTAEPQSELTHGRYDYEHPIFTPSTAAAQQRSIDIQGQRHSWFAGAYLGHGFHEDGLQSGLWVADQLGAPAPWFSAAPRGTWFNRVPDSYEQSLRHAA